MNPDITIWPANMPWLQLPVLDIADNGAGTMRFTIGSTRYEATNATIGKLVQELLANMRVREGS